MILSLLGEEGVLILHADGLEYEKRKRPCAKNQHPSFLLSTGREKLSQVHSKNTVQLTLVLPKTFACFPAPNNFMGAATVFGNGPGKTCQFGGTCKVKYAKILPTKVCVKIIIKWEIKNVAIVILPPGENSERKLECWCVQMFPLIEFRGSKKTRYFCLFFSIPKGEKQNSKKRI